MLKKQIYGFFIVNFRYRNTRASANRLDKNGITDNSRFNVGKKRRLVGIAFRAVISARRQPLVHTHFIERALAQFVRRAYNGHSDFIELFFILRQQR